MCITKRYLHVFYLLQVDCRLGPSDPTDKEVSYWYYGPVTKNQHQFSIATQNVERVVTIE